MQIKGNSKSVMIPARSHDGEFDLPGWPRTASFSCLGGIIENDGGHSADIKHAVAAMWRAFFATAGAPQAKESLAIQSRRNLLQKSARSLLAARCPRWPPTEAMLKHIGRTQRRMLAAISRLPPNPGEDAGAYMRRRARCASDESRRQGLWSEFVLRRCKSWGQPLQRATAWPNPSWAARALALDTRAMLMQRRVDRGSLPTGGRTGTRVSWGRVNPRWQESCVRMGIL